MFNLQTIQNLKGIETPYYLYDLDLLDQTIEEARKASDKYNIKIHYALKANYNKPILQKIIAAGFGADCVSGGEVKKALESGFSSQSILMAGVGKTDEEIALALDSKIECLNCESIEEIEIIAAIAASKKCVASIALRINPDVNAFTHQHISTGTEEDKFGIAISELTQVTEFITNNKSLKLIGLHFHIGSQISEIGVFETLCEQVNKINQWFIQKGIILTMINMGGGLSIDYYKPNTNPIADFDTHFSKLRNSLKLKDEQQVHVELGRSIVGQCGNLVARVLYGKKTAKKEFLILDAGMTELIRPALYQAYHHIERLDTNFDSDKKHLYTIVGPICESSDTFANDVPLSPTKRGDMILIRSAGAYGEVMSSNYNLRKKAEVYYIEKGHLSS